jgi:serine/threonine-protein kinase
MPLQKGTKLGSHEILEPIGAGGMGQVYRARDTKLGRDVAIKVLPEVFAQDKKRLARFEREARLLASLNHPNIAAIYELEESDGVHYLVLELVPGETLADKITRGSIPIDEALPLFRQIAEALEAAHETGVIHRDLKPANIKVTPEAKVKVLDFGLAKALAPEEPLVDSSQSPTLTKGTALGAIMGTAAYMSPEQARGKPVDKRTDIWAFGCCLYEALTGRKAFAGETVTDTIAAVVNTEPKWEALPSAMPRKSRELLRRCLLKDPLLRLRDIGEARIEIAESLTATSTGAAAAEPTRRSNVSRIITVGIATGLAAVLGFWGRGYLGPTAPASLQPMRLLIELSPEQRIMNRQDCVPLVLTPDGRRLAFVGGVGGDQQIFVRSMEDIEAKAVPGTAGLFGTSFFVSPDGEWVGYYKDEKLWKVRFDGGEPVPLLDSAANIWHASWGEDDFITYAAGAITGLARISSDGGEPEALTHLDTSKGEIWHGSPRTLPGGKAVLFSVNVGNYDTEHVEVLSLETGERRVLIDDAERAEYVPSGHLVFVRGGTLYAVPFDLDRLRVAGPEVPILSGVQLNRSGRSPLFTVSTNGTLIYVPSGQRIGEGRLVWVNRQGEANPIAVEAGFYGGPKLSPNGEQLVVRARRDDSKQLLLYDLARQIPTQITFEGNENDFPVWTPEGTHIAFESDRAGPYNMFSMPIGGDSRVERLRESDRFQYPCSWSSDGSLLAYHEISPDERFDVYILRRDQETEEPEPFLTTESNELSARFSPNDTWIAYVSDETGRFEIYIKKYIPGSPDAGRKTQVSRDGGWEPVWSRDGKELFYRDIEGRRLMAVSVQTEPELRVSEPRFLFEEPNTPPPEIWGSNSYDVAPDGRFVMISETENRENPMKLIVVLNWLEELNRLVPTN